jgi:predicted amidohydrolase YtcJ
MFADGSMSGRTAWVSEPYAESEDHGYPTITVEAMQAGYEWARRNRVQVSVHAMGDLALQRVIDFFADEEPWMGPDIPSVRLEHATLLTDEQMRRLRDATMSFGVATQIIFFFAEYESYAANLTASQFRRAYPLRTFYDRIERLGLSSDAPATTWADPDDVFVSIQAAVTRRAYNGADIVPDQALTVPEAVLLYTARAATLGRYEEPVGRIAEGREANFVVLDRDLFTIDPGAIHETRVAETWMRGEKVFERR